MNRIRERKNRFLDQFERRINIVIIIKIGAITVTFTAIKEGVSFSFHTDTERGKTMCRKRGISWRKGEKGLTF